MTNKHIVFIHGMWSGEWTFEAYDKFFSQQGYTCHRPVLRYHNDVEPSPAQKAALGRTGIQDYAEDLEAFINTLDSKPVLIGHSMGGLLAQILAAKGLAEKAVLICPAAPAGVHGLTLSVVRSFLGVMSKWGFWHSPNKISFNAAKYALLNKIEPSQQKALYDQLCYESGKAAFEIGFWLVDPNKSTKADLNNIDCPILMVSGEDDHITPAVINKKNAQLLLDYKLDITHKVYPNHAHWLLAEPGWEDITNDISQWLSEQ